MPLGFFDDPTAQPPVGAGLPLGMTLNDVMAMQAARQQAAAAAFAAGRGQNPLLAPPQATAAPASLTSGPTKGPDDYMRDWLASGALKTGIAQSPYEARRLGEGLTNVADWTPLGIPQAAYSGGQMLGRGAQQLANAPSLSGLGQAGLGAGMMALAAVPGVGKAAPEGASLLSKAATEGEGLLGKGAQDARLGSLSATPYTPAGPGEVNPQANPFWQPQRIWVPGKNRPAWQAGEAPPLIDMATLQTTPKNLFDKNVNLMRDYPNIPQSVADKGSTADVAAAAHDHLVNNILALHDSIPAAERANTMEWYDGANRIVKDWSQQYRLPENAVAGMIAALSPKRDWFQNVGLAQRLLDINYGGNGSIYLGHALDPEMAATFRNTESMQTPDFKAMFRDIKGKTLADIDNMDLSPKEAGLYKAFWSRLYDEAHNDRSFQAVNPNGTFGDFVQNKGGDNTRIASGTGVQYGTALRLVDAAKSGNMDQFSELLGNKHKVRNFYNNIIDPKSPLGDYTGDTHAVAAAWLRPLSQANEEVMHNFQTTPLSDNPIWPTFQGAGGSDVTGVRGTYPVYADAYRAAAAQRGLTPRQMQSITWEGVRKLFPDTFKTPENLAAVNDIWKEYRAGKINQQEAQNRVFDYANERVQGGPSGGDGAPRNPVDAGSLGPPQSLGGAPVPVDVGGRGGGAAELAGAANQRPAPAATSQPVRTKVTPTGRQPKVKKPPKLPVQDYSEE